MPETVRVSFAGIRLDLLAPPQAFLREDSLWRMKQHYEPFLATVSLPAEGVAVDIGAGFGAFAVPFAKRYPGWQLWCFEPDAAAFAALNTNIERAGLQNVRAFPLAVAAAGPGDDRLTTALRNGDHATLAELCTTRPFRRSRHHDGFLDARTYGATPGGEEGFEPVVCATLPAAALRALQPDVLKLMAPHAEEGILGALEGCEPAFLLGETWQFVSPDRLNGKTRAAWVPFARARGLGLRCSPASAQKPASVAVVIDAGEVGEVAVAATLAALPAEAWLAAHLVLSPGRALSSAAIRPDLPVPLSVHHADQPGAAAAFNLGRRRSTSSHIAFLRAGDLPECGSLKALRTLALLSGAEIVQGGGTEGPVWTDLPRESVFTLEGLDGSFLPASRMMADFAPSRARLYRRDFLDAQGLWFPEHLRGFADYHLHFLALMVADTLPVLPGAVIAPAPAAGLLGTEAFHLPEVLRLVVKRALIEGWSGLAPLFDGFARAVRAAALQLDPTLRRDFVEALAEALAMSEKALGPAMPRPAGQVVVEMPGLADRIRALQAARRDIPDGYAWGWLDAPALQAPMIAQARLWRDMP